MEEIRDVSLVKYMIRDMPLPMTLKVITGVSKLWKRAALMEFNEKALKLIDEEGCVDLSTVANVFGGSVSWIMKYLQYTFSFSDKLKVTASYEVTDRKLFLIAKKNPNITALSLYGCKHITSPGILDAVSLLPRLEYLDIRECSRVERSIGIQLFHSIKFVEFGDNSTVCSQWENMELQPNIDEIDFFIECFRVLELDEHATFGDLKKAYRRLSKMHHPDKAKTQVSREYNAKFIEIDNSYKYLCSLLNFYA